MNKCESEHSPPPKIIIYRYSTFSARKKDYLINLELIFYFKVFTNAKAENLDSDFVLNIFNFIFIFGYCRIMLNSDKIFRIIKNN